MFFSNNYRCTNIGPEELQRMLASRDEFVLLDVRTRQEHAEQRIEKSHLIPLQELPDRVHELPRDKEIVIYCRVGNRSAYACSLLASRGYRVKNLEGGIMLWNMAGSASMRA